MKIKKIVASVLALSLVAAVSIAGTMAYLTNQSDKVTNTFSVGKVAVTLDEKDVTKTDGSRTTANAYKLIPGSEYDKDPTVHVTQGSEKCYVFVKVANGLGNAEAAVENLGTIAEQMANKGWKQVEDKAGYYVYKTTVNAAEQQVDLPVFEKFAIKGDLTDEAYRNLVNVKIELTACVVQAEGLNLADAVANLPANF